MMSIYTYVSLSLYMNMSGRPEYFRLAPGYPTSGSETLCSLFILSITEQYYEAPPNKSVGSEFSSLPASYLVHQMQPSTKAAG